MRISRKILENKLDYINQVTGLKYFFDYNKVYGGYSIYYTIGDSTGLHTGILGRDDRLSAFEMYLYLSGIINGFAYINHIQETKKYGKNNV